MIRIEENVRANGNTDQFINPSKPFLLVQENSQLGFSNLILSRHGLGDLSSSCQICSKWLPTTDSGGWLSGTITPSQSDFGSFCLRGQDQEIMPLCTAGTNHHTLLLGPCVEAGYDRFPAAAGGNTCCALLLCRAGLVSRPTGCVGQNVV